MIAPPPPVLEPLPDERERGLPSVNPPASATRWTRGLVYGLLVLGLPLAGVVLYSRATRDPVDATPRQQAMPLTSTVPARTFNLPAPAVPSPPPAVVTPASAPVVSAAHSVPAPPPPPARPAGQTPPPHPPPALDKSEGVLMVEAGASLPAVAATARREETPAAGQDTNLGAWLSATATPPRSASLLPDRDYLLAKGTFIDCALATRLDSTVPGLTSCRVTQPIYSDTGRVVLVDRGATVSGEYQSLMRQGMARIFVLWTRIKTPTGVVVSLDSPATDALGGSGIPGYVDTHFWQRFGGALLLSLVDDAVAAAAATRRGDGQTMINFGGTSNTAQTMAAEALRNTINIPPTLSTNQGARVGIYVARDLSFKAVYDLQPSGLEYP